MYDGPKIRHAEKEEYLLEETAKGFVVDNVRLNVKEVNHNDTNHLGAAGIVSTNQDDIEQKDVFHPIHRFEIEKDG